MSSMPDVDSLATYGGAMANYAPVEDPTTDRDATAANKAYASTAAMTHTATRLWCRFQTNTTTGTMILIAFDSTWGSALDGRQPALARAGTGLFTLTVPATIVDELGVTHAIALRGGYGNCESASTPYFVSISTNGASQITVAVFNAAGALNDAAGVSFSIAVY